eukprot:11168914-Lingulodinium_polyedra.AAC.1
MGDRGATARPGTRGHAVQNSKSAQAKITVLVAMALQRTSSREPWRPVAASAPWASPAPRARRRTHAHR